MARTDVRIDQWRRRRHGHALCLDRLLHHFIGYQRSRPPEAALSLRRSAVQGAGRAVRGTDLQDKLPVSEKAALAADIRARLLLTDAVEKGLD